MNEKEQKPYRRLILAVVEQAVKDLRSGDEHNRASAEHFLLTHGPAYLDFAGISRPKKKIVAYVRAEKKRRSAIGRSWTTTSTSMRRRARSKNTPFSA